MTTTDSVKPERIYEPLQFELEDAPEDVKAFSLVGVLSTGELITNDTIMNGLTMGFNQLPRVAPTTAARVRITELLTDEVRHCYMNDHLARALGGDPSTVSYFSTGDAKAEMAAAATPGLAELLIDRLGSLQTPVDETTRPASDRSPEPIHGGFESLASLAQVITRGMLASVNGKSAGSFDSYLWAMFAVFNMCIDRVAGMMVEDTVNASFAPLARMNRTICIDEAGHAQTGFYHLRDVCRTQEGRDQAQTALDAIWPVSVVMFDTIPPEALAEGIRLGLMDHTHAELKQKYVEVTVPLLDGLGLCASAA